MDNELRQNVESAAKRLAVTGAIAVGAMLIVSAWAWARIPADKLVPVHWGANLQPDGYAHKSIGLFWAPELAAIATVLLAGAMLYTRSENLARSARAYVAVGTSLLALLLGCQIAVVLVAVGRKVDMPTVTVAMLGLVFVILGNYMGKMRRNRLMGVRTPWTLSSDLCWNKTHRLAGRLCVGLGLMLIAVALAGVRPECMAVIFLVASLAVLLLVSVYSYAVWRAEQRHA